MSYFDIEEACIPQCQLCKKFAGSRGVVWHLISMHDKLIDASNFSVVTRQRVDI